MNKLGVRCTVCGTYLHNYISKVLLKCKEHRPPIAKEQEDQFRQFVRKKFGSPTATSEKEK